MRKPAFIIAQGLALAGFLGFAALVAYGLIAADISAEGSLMLGVFWGKFTFVDIYAAFIVFYLWVFYKETSWWGRILWFVLIMGGGSLSICLYLFIALRKSRGDMNQLLTGRN
ncbi:MAG: DUF1475 family protein [Clostridia bacterium]